MKPSDVEITKRWERVVRLQNRGTSLAIRLAGVEADKLEAEGVTENDIDRLFKETCTPMINADWDYDLDKPMGMNSLIQAEVMKERAAIIKVLENRAKYFDGSRDVYRTWEDAARSYRTAITEIENDAIRRDVSPE